MTKQGKAPVFYRQGDLLITLVDEIPKKIKTTPKGDKIVLEGEITNHNHEIKSGNVLLVAPQQEVSRSETETLPYAYLNLSQKTELVHPEHKPIELAKGVYEVRRQREVRGVVLD